MNDKEILIIGAGALALLFLSRARSVTVSGSTPLRGYAVSTTTGSTTGALGGILGGLASRILGAPGTAATQPAASPSDSSTDMSQDQWLPHPYLEATDYDSSAANPSSGSNPPADNGAYDFGGQ